MQLQREKGGRSRVVPERRRRPGGLPVVTLLCLGMLVASSALAFAAVSQPEQKVLRFGFDLRTTPQEDARQYLPFLNYLKRETGYTFELRFTPVGASIVDLLGQGEVQIAAIGADSYLQAQAKYGVVPLVRGLNAHGKAVYQAVIVVAPHSPIRKIEELRGKRFAFGAKNSTQGHLIPLIILAEHGLGLENLAGYEFTGSHLDCANAVAAGRFAAGGIQDTLGRELAEAGLLRIIHTSRFYPSSGIAANKNVPPAVLARVRKALLDFQPQGRDAADLYHWDRTEMPNGFMPARDEDYAELRKWAVRLGYYSELGQQ